MWNKELYVREQQDAYEFFTSLIDQMDEYLKVEKTCIFPSHSLKVQHENSALEFGITNQKVIIFNTTTVIHLIWVWISKYTEHYRL